MPEDVIIQIVRGGKREEVRATVKAINERGDVHFAFKEPHTFNEGDEIEVVGYTYDAGKLAAEFKAKREAGGPT